MNAIIQTYACIKRNNRFVLLFLGFVIIIWMEVLSSEKTVFQQLLSSPLYEDLTEEDLMNMIHDKRILSGSVALLLSFLNMAYVSFVLYMGHFYINSVERKGYRQWFKIAFFTESYYLLYRLYMVVIKFFELDLEKWDIKERLSLANILDTSDWGIFANMLNMPLDSVNVISITYCIVLTCLISNIFRMKFLKSLKYVLCTYVLITVVLMCLLSFVMFINA